MVAIRLAIVPIQNHPASNVLGKLVISTELDLVWTFARIRNTTAAEIESELGDYNSTYPHV